MIRFRSLSCLLLLVALALPVCRAASGPKLEDIVGGWFCDAPRILINVAADGAMVFTPLGEPPAEETRVPLKDFVNGVGTWEFPDATLRSRFEAGWLEFSRTRNEGGKSDTLTCRRIVPDADRPILAEAEKAREAVRQRKEIRRAAVAALMAPPAPDSAPPAAPVAPANAEPAVPPDTFDIRSVSRSPRASRQVKPTFPSSMRRPGQTGQVVIEFIVAKDGSVLNPRVLTSSHRDFEGPALEAIRQWKFQPGLLGNRVVNTKMTMPFQFRQ